MGHPLADTMQASRREPLLGIQRKVAFLIRALECEDPLAGASRHCLEGLDHVSIERGPRAHFRQANGDAAALTLRIPDPKISAKHAVLRRDREGWRFEDAGSRNGSLVDGVARGSARLTDRTMIEVGSTVLLFREMPVEHEVLADKIVYCAGTPFDTLSVPLEETAARLQRVANSQLSVLLLGETGTGKEVFARAVHLLSGRQGPFVPVNCGAIPPALIEAALFGHVRGAFTSAIKDEIGLVRSAEGGTLFLDEIADLSLSSQAALLRVLQDGEVTPVGSTRAVRSDVRIVAATHKHLDALMDQELFRRDLYSRLAGHIHALPCLRHRPEDIGLLSVALLERHASGRPVQLRIDAARALFTYPFPLNVRELEQSLCAALVFAGTEAITFRYLPDKLRGTQGSTPPSPLPARSSSPSLTRSLSPEESALRDSLVAALRETSGNVTEAARRMGKARQQIQRWLRRFELDPLSFRADS